ncbi:hypothetical protein FHW72_002289 [Ochrobactrum sp. RC6B]|nr:MULTISPECIES: hypothetical protein [Brucella/Ochrobactrum group]MBB3217207.1 hypothetical protein [Ochrobactrum sp. RC6B]
MSALRFIPDISLAFSSFPKRSFRFFLLLTTIMGWRGAQALQADNLHEAGSLEIEVVNEVLDEADQVVRSHIIIDCSRQKQ